MAELHHRADFEDNDLRYLTALWRAPLLLPLRSGSMRRWPPTSPPPCGGFTSSPEAPFFVDEAHAALPVHLFPSHGIGCGF